MHEQIRPGQPDGGHKERGFPLKGHTLFVNSIGQRASEQAIRFLEILNYSHGSDELLETASAFGAHDQIAPPMKQAMHVSPGLFRQPEIAINNLPGAIAAFRKYSQKHQESGRAVFHFMSYQRGVGQLTQDVLGQFQHELPDVFHLGILVIPSSDPLSMRQFQREAEAFPLERLGVPLIVIDETLYRERFFGQSMMVTEDGFLYGLAGLVADRGLFPDLNKHNYKDVLQTLADETGVIGVGVASGTIKEVNGWDPIMVPDPFKTFVSDMTALSLSDKYRISSLPRKLNAELDIAAVQMPMSTENGSWKDPHFFREIHPRHSEEVSSGSITLPDHIVYLYGNAKTPTKSWDDPKPMTSTHFYPAARTPGVDFLLELLRREAPAPAPVPVPA